MKTNSFVAFSVFGALAAAAPYKGQLPKRDLAVVTEYSQVIETVFETATVWVDPTEQAAPTSAAETPVQTPAETPVQTPVQTPANTPVNTPVSTPVYTPQSSSVEVASSTEVIPSSTYVAPTSTVTPSSVYTPTPEPSTTKAPTSSYVAPSSSKAASTTVSSDAAVTAESTGSSEVYTGSITHYTVGLGACGWTNSDSDPVVALAAGNMGAQSNGNEWCGKNITISYAGNEVQAYIVDKCPGCKPWSLDLSPSLFQSLAPQVDGTTDGVKWWVN